MNKFGTMCCDGRRSRVCTNGVTYMARDSPSVRAHSTRRASSLDAPARLENSTLLQVSQRLEKDFIISNQKQSKNIACKYTPREGPWDFKSRHTVQTRYKYASYASMQ
jgi:hypothetical protein